MVPNTNNIIHCISDDYGKKYAKFRDTITKDIFEIYKEYLLDDYLYLNMMSMSIG
jgi:hypothetical protein